MGSGTLSRLSKGRHLMSSNETATSSFSRHLLQALLGAQARTVRFASLAPLVQNLLNRAIMIVHVCCSLVGHGWLVTNWLWSHCCGDRCYVGLVALWVLSAELSLLLPIEWLQTVVEDKYQVVIISSYSKLFESSSGQYFFQLTIEVVFLWRFSTFHSRLWRGAQCLVLFRRAAASTCDGPRIPRALKSWLFCMIGRQFQKKTNYSFS